MITQIANVKIVTVTIAIVSRNILLSCVSCLVLSGCYTQLSMFYPEPEIEEEEEFYSYSLAGPVKSVGMYAQDGAGQSLGMAYSTMYNRFQPYSGFGNQYYTYGNGGYYNNSYTLGGYTMYIPVAQYPDKGTPRTWTRDSKSSVTNLTVTRTRSTQSSTNSSGHSNSSNVSSTRGTSSSSSSSSSSGGRRATRRN